MGDLSRIDTETRKMRAGTWSDSELEELYDIKTMAPDSAMKTKHLLQVLKAIRHCNKSRTLDDAIKVVVERTCEILGCDRATLFIVDEIREELVIRQAIGVEDIRIPLDAKSIAGDVYQTGIKANIENAYDDPRFNSGADERSGYKTESVLCCPIWDAKYQTVAVLQAVNKLKSKSGSPSHAGGSPSSSSFGIRLFKKRAEAEKEKTGEKGSDVIAFTREDEVLMDHLSLQLGVIIRNQMLREESDRAHKQVVSLLDIVRSLHSNLGTNSLMFTITERSPSLVDADRCTLYIVDHKHDELWSIQGAIEIRAPLSKGLAGYTATTGEIINIEDAHKDERFNTEYDLKTGFRTKSVLVMPITDKPLDGSESKVIGVLQCINKLHGNKFTEQDEHLLGSFLDIVGALLMTSQLFNQITSKKQTTEFGAAQDIEHSSSNTSPANKKQQQPPLFFPDMIAEEADEEAASEEEEQQH